MRSVALLGLSLCVLASPVASQGSRPLGRWDREVAAELRRAGQALEQQGYHMRDEPMLGTLNQGEVDSLWAGLRDGVAYALVGVCDSACTNLDLRLFDIASHEIAAALEPGPPVLRVTPTQRTKYRLRVIMTACNHSPCRYSIGIFER